MHRARQDRPFRIGALALTTLGCLWLVAPPSVAAQAGGAQAGGLTKEFGLDAALIVGLGDESSFQVTVPAARMRVGFLQPASRWSLEPAIGLNYTRVEGADGVLVYNIEGGALYHFRPAGDLRSMGASVAYLRPFVGIVGFTGDDSDSEVSVGAGFGVKIPWQEQLAWRLEANAGYGFDNEAFRLGAYAGVSFFTNR